MDWNSLNIKTLCASENKAGFNLLLVKTGLKCITENGDPPFFINELFSLFEKKPKCDIQTHFKD